MRDIKILINEDHSVEFDNDYAGLNQENLQGNITFSFKNFVDGQARAEVILDNDGEYEDGYILLDKVGQTYTMPIKSSLLNCKSIIMQLVIDLPGSFIITTDIHINTNKTYYQKLNDKYVVVEHPNQQDLPTYYEASVPVWKSETFTLKVGFSINATSTIPEDYPSWIEILNNLIEEVDQAVEEANNLDLDMTNENGVVIAEITKKDGSVKEVEVIDTNDYYTKEEIDNKGYINKDVDDLTNYTKTSDLSEVATSGSYNDLEDTPNLSVYSLITETGAKIDLEINSSTYVLTAKLYDKNNDLLSTSTGIDLPLETMVIGATYDSETKEIVLTLKNGTQVRFSVADLVSGLVSETQLQQILLNYYTKSEVDTLLSNKVGFTDYASSSTGGVLKTGNGVTADSNGVIRPDVRSYADYGTSGNTLFISKGTLENVIAGKELTNKTYVDEANASQDSLIEELQAENTYLNSIINQMPKVSSQGTILTLNNTIAGKMNIELGTSELEQETTTGKNKCNKNGTLSLPPDTTKTILDTGIKLTYTGATVTPPVYSFATLVMIDLSNYVGKTVRFKSNFTTSGTNVGKYLIGISKSDGSGRISKTSAANSGEVVSFEVPELSGEVTYLFVNLYQANNSDLTTNDSISFTNMIATIDNSNMDYEPYTGGIPAPIPSYPMPIHTISGNNKVVVRGIQLFDKNNDNIITNKYLNASGVETSDSSFSISDYIGAEANTTYASQPFENKGACICFYDSSKTFLSSIALANVNPDFTTPNNCKYIRTSIWKADIDIVQINKGNIALPYEEYKGTNYTINLGDIEYCEIGDYKDEFDRSSGINKFDESQLLEATGWTKTNNVYSGTVGNWHSKFRTGFTGLTFEENTQYTISFKGYTTGGSPRLKIVYSDSTTENVNITATSMTSYTKTTTANKTISSIQADFGTGSVYTLYLTEFIINKGTTALPYEPYGIGNWGIRKNIGKVVLDGSETYGIYDSGSYATNPYFTKSGVSDYINTNEIYCNQLTGGNISSSTNAMIQRTANQILFQPSNGILTIEDWKTWLSNNNLIYYIPLITPTYTPITGTLAEELENVWKAQSKSGQTNISQVNNDLPFNISASALLDLNTLVGE